MKRYKNRTNQAKKYISSIGVVELATYTSPKISESRQNDWVSYGDNNDYFTYLIDRWTGSPTNSAAINGISQMIFGNGLDASDSSKNPEGYAQMKVLLNDEIVEKLAFDLKAMGNCAVQVIYSIDRSKILELAHFPIETLRSGKCNEEGDVDFYYYSNDWSNLRNNKPLPIPSFGTSKEPIEVLYIKPYKSGYYFYSPVDYQGSLQYCSLEEEISNYHINNVKNGLAPSMMISFNNGVPTIEEQRDIENAIVRKFSGSSNAGKFVLSFNDSAANASTMTPVQLSDAHSQYQFLSDESMRKIMISHRIVSPMLLGIKDNSGFGNNADELKTASILMDNTVIRPFQNILIKAFNKLLSYNDISLKLYFKTLQPLEFTDLSNAINSEQVEEETGQKLSKQIDLNDYGEEIDLNEYELVSSNPVNYDLEEALDKEMNKLNSVHLADVKTGVARTRSISEQDTKLYITRYRYSGNTSPEREFCKKMMTAKKLYRKEDIEAMSNDNVNPGFGMNPNPNNPYDIFLWKGGGKLSDSYNFGTCKHYWVREMYRKIGTGKNTAAQQSTPAEVRKAGEIAPTNNPKAYIAPHDM